jgi:hypothetical protein
MSLMRWHWPWEGSVGSSDVPDHDRIARELDGHVSGGRIAAFPQSQPDLPSPGATDDRQAATPSSASSETFRPPAPPRRTWPAVGFLVLFGVALILAATSDLRLHDPDAAAPVSIAGWVTAGIGCAGAFLIGRQVRARWIATGPVTPPRKGPEWLPVAYCAAPIVGLGLGKAVSSEAGSAGTALFAIFVATALMMIGCLIAGIYAGRH